MPPTLSNGKIHSLDMVLVEGTRGQPYAFGEAGESLKVEVGDFFIATVTTTQSLWTYVMGANPSIGTGDHRPVQNVSWDEITHRDGFLDRINTSPILAHMARQLPGTASAVFRLPSETEWEYAARGGPHWTRGCIGFRLVLRP